MIGGLNFEHTVLRFYAYVIEKEEPVEIQPLWKCWRCGLFSEFKTRIRRITHWSQVFFSVRAWNFLTNWKLNKKLNSGQSSNTRRRSWQRDNATEMVTRKEINTRRQIIHIDIYNVSFTYYKSYFYYWPSSTTPSTGIQDRLQTSTSIVHCKVNTANPFSDNIDSSKIKRLQTVQTALA